MGWFENVGDLLYEQIWGSNEFNLRTSSHDNIGVRNLMLLQLKIQALIVTPRLDSNIEWKSLNNTYLNIIKLLFYFLFFSSFKTGSIAERSSGSIISDIMISDWGPGFESLLGTLFSEQKKIKKIKSMLFSNFVFDDVKFS